MKKYILIICGLLMGSAAISRAATRSDRLMWTDRSLSSGSYTQSASIEPTINRFWNVLESDLEEEKIVKMSPVCTTRVVAAKPKMEASQTRNEQEHRGHIGINLFNLIPLIDIVHGEVRTESSDHVSGQK